MSWWCLRQVKKRKVVAVPSFRLSEPQITELKNLFDCYDLNRSGSASSCCKCLCCVMLLHTSPVACAVHAVAWVVDSH